MEDIKIQCYKILSLLEESQLKEKDYYSVVRIKRAIKQLLSEINDDNSKLKNDINIESLSRNFVDDTGDYSNNILVELEKLSSIIKNKS